MLTDLYRPSLVSIAEDASVDRLTFGKSWKWSSYRKYGVELFTQQVLNAT